MKWMPFHHPDIVLPVIRRKVGEELIELLSGTAALVLSRGASELYGHCYPNERAFRASISRLEKKGLLVKPSTRGAMPSLELTTKGHAAVSDYFRPQKFWSKKWNKWWYVLMFDVPETDRQYRNTLRAFLKKMRLGCLQKSVWITPWDIRADYDDLDRAAAVDTVAFLLEARTVLGYGNQSLVQEAWDFDWIQQVQQLYIAFVSENLKRLSSATPGPDELLQLLRIENQAFAQAMSIDPLLPEELLPPDYVGQRSYALHRECIERVADHL